MKSFNSLLIALLAVVMLASFTAFSQNTVGQECTCLHHSGELNMLGTFNGFSNTSVSNFNNGFGVELFVTHNVSLRGTLGFQSTWQNNQWHTNYANASAAALWEIGSTDNTGAYAGPQITYGNQSGEVDAWSVSLPVGMEFYPWKHVGFFAEYGIGFMTVNKTTTITFGSVQTSGLGLRVQW